MNNGENWTAETYTKAENALGYTFRDKTLLITCFTHTSYTNVSGEQNNERLEFLGDAVLELYVTDKLYREEGGSEGKLTNARKNYVSEEALTPIAEELGLMRFLRYSGGEQNLGKKTPSSLFEAVVAGIYLDGGMQAAQKFLGEHLAFSRTVDYKSRLQELAQKAEKVQPVYETREGGDGFVSQVRALGEEAEGRGESKKAAETAAAKALYIRLTENKS